MSRTVIPRAYSAMTFSSKPTRRVWRLATICGSKVPLRSRGERIRTAPWSVSTVLGGRPLRAFPVPPGGA